MTNSESHTLPGHQLFAHRTSPVPASDVPPPPFTVMSLRNASRAFGVLKTALELNIFAIIADKTLSVDAIAHRAETQVVPTERLLNALTGLLLLEKVDGQYRLSSEALAYLLPDSPLFLGPYVVDDLGFDRAWETLTNHLRTGRKVNYFANMTDEEKSRVYPRMAKNIAGLSFHTATLVGQSLNVGSLNNANLLDIAAGSGAWSIPLAIQNSSLRVDAVDYASTLEVTKEYARLFGVDSQFRYVANSWQVAEFTRSHYHLVTIGHLIHYESEEAIGLLFSKCYDAMRRGGRLIIGEFLPNDEKTAPAYHMLFDLSMSFTGDGSVYTVPRLAELLSKVGFVETSRLQIAHYGEFSPVIVARRPV